MARHACYPVIQHDDCPFCSVVVHIDQAGYPRMEESGVPQHSNDVLAVPDSLLKSVSHSDGSAHAKTCVHGRRRRQRAQGVTSDITHDRLLELIEYVKQSSVRTSGAHERRPARSICRISLGFGRFSQRQPECFPYHVGAVFALYGEHILASGKLYTHSSYLFLKEWVPLLYHVELIHSGSEILYQLFRYRIDEPHLQHTGIRHRVFHILIADTTGNDADRRISHLDPIYLHGITVGCHLSHSLFLCHVELLRHGRHGHILLDILLVRDPFPFCPLAYLHDSSGMGYPGI